MNRSRLLSLLSVLILAAAPLRAPAEPAPALTQISQIRNLRPEECDNELPLKIRAVVTWVTYNSFVVQDDTGGLTVNVGLAKSLNIWPQDDFMPGVPGNQQMAIGDEVEVEGVTHSGGYAPNILPRHFKVLGKREPPAARPMDPLRFFNGADAGERIEIHGVVKGFQRHKSGNLTLHLLANNGTLTVEIYNSVLPDPTSVVDADVCLRGVAGTFFNSRGEATGVRLLVGRREDLVIEKKPTLSPFDAPKLALNHLFPFNPNPAPPHRQLVEGTVTYAQSEHVFYLQDGEAAMRIDTMDAAAIKPGDRVQASGFLDRQRAFAGLSDALVRKIGTAPVPDPLAISPDLILKHYFQALQLGGNTRKGDFDGRLIRFTGKLISVQTSPNQRPPWQWIELKVNGMVVEALLYQGLIKAFDGMQPGSELQVTGIVEMVFDLSAQKQSLTQIPPYNLHIWLRDLNDVQLISTPPWWTARRLFFVVLLAALVALGAWRWERLRHQRKILSLEAARSLECDRVRISRDLHDELGVGLTEIGLLGDLVVGASLPDNEKDLGETISARARSLVASLDEIVWAINPLNDNSLSMGDYFSLYAETLLKRAGLRCQIEVCALSETVKISSEIRHHLYLAFKETLNNTVTHARAHEVKNRIALESSGQLVISVTDDGAGFNPEAADKITASGLKNMKNRLQQIGGKCEIQSAPGKGTVVRFCLPLSPQ